MAIKTVLTYQLNGSTTEFGVPFEYLSRRFVKVWLVGNTRRELTLNVDYRFINKKTIRTTQAWGSAQGYKYIEIRRVTSATDRVVDFTDGSILRASDLNASQIQAMHIAEEARDLAADALYVDDNGNLDARGRKIVNVGEGRESTRDAVTMQFIGKTTNSIVQMRDQVKKDTATTATNKTLAETARKGAEAARDAAKVSEGKAKTSETNAKSYEVKAKESMGSAQASENNARDSENKARADAQVAEAARIASKQSETKAKDSEVKARDSEVNAKVYSDGASSNKAQIDRLAGLVKEADGLTDKAKAYAKDASNSSVASAQHAQASAASAEQSDTNLTKCKGHEAATAVYEAEALKSKDAAKVSETNAKTSETKAKTSENNAKKYSDNVDTNANRIQEVSKLIEDAKQTVKQTEAYAKDASKSSVASAQSAQSAAASAEQTDLNLTKCKGHEAATAVYEEEARKSKEEAKVSETNASLSENAAESSATLAQTSRAKADQARVIAESKANEAKGSETSAAASAKAAATSATQAAESARSILGQLELNTAQADRAAESARQAAASALSVNADNLVTKTGLLTKTGQATNNTMTQKAISDSLDSKQPKIGNNIDIRSATTEASINFYDTSSNRCKVLWNPTGSAGGFAINNVKDGSFLKFPNTRGTHTIATMTEVNLKADKLQPEFSSWVNVKGTSSSYIKLSLGDGSGCSMRNRSETPNTLEFVDNTNFNVRRLSFNRGGSSDELALLSDVATKAPIAKPNFTGSAKITGNTQSYIELETSESKITLYNSNERGLYFYKGASRRIIDFTSGGDKTLISKEEVSELLPKWKELPISSGSGTDNLVINIGSDATVLFVSLQTNAVGKAQGFTINVPIISKEVVSRQAIDIAGTTVKVAITFTTGRLNISKEGGVSKIINVYVLGSNLDA